MAIDFTLSPELEDLRKQIRSFIEDVVIPLEENIDEDDRKSLIEGIIEMRKEAQERGVAPPHAGGVGRHGTRPRRDGHGAGRGRPPRFGPFAINAQAPDEGNMHTLLHWGTDEQKEKYPPALRGRGPLVRAMTEPEVVGSDPTLIQTKGYQDGDEWVIDGHKWFISGAHRANFAILLCRTEDDPDLPQAANTAFIVELPAEGWNEVREIETMHGSTGTWRSSSRTCGCTTTRCSAAGVRATCSASIASAPPGWRTACAGSPRRRWRWT